jgi:hypothetical protein
MRCGPAEKLRPPFVSRSDLGKAGSCRDGYAARAPADSGASAGVGSGVETIILTAVKPPLESHLAKIEVTPAALRKLRVDAGYDVGFHAKLPIFSGRAALRVTKLHRQGRHQLLLAFT